MTLPTLVFGWGNPARGDDALGPMFVEAVEAMGLPGVECLTDFQLQVEHALDLRGRSRILFVDASMSAAAPYCVEPLTAIRDDSFSSHAMTPAAVLHVFRDVEVEAPPPAVLLSIRGQQWKLGDPPSAMALENLSAALVWAQQWLTQPMA